MSEIRVLVNGAKGRMGQESVKAIGAEADLKLVGETDLGDDLAGRIAETQAQVVVDFTTPAVAFEMAEIIVASGAGGVIGTTGFKPDQIAELEKKCAGRKPAFMIVPNFSIGALLMMKFSELAAPHMPQAEVIEMHHDKKMDSPSGTAVKTAEMMDSARKAVGKSFSPVHPEDAARGMLVADTPVHSVRLPGLLAHQQVILGGQGQTLTIRHDSLDRTCFMPGVVMAVRAVMEREGLVYGLDKVLFE